MLRSVSFSGIVTRMSETERGDARAQGALDNFIQGMKCEMQSRRHSDEYVKQFWATLREEMAQRAGKEMQ
jgi:hypothetical protein